MYKDKIPYYSNEFFLEEIRSHNLNAAKTGRGEFRYNAVFIDLNAVDETPEGEKIAVSCNFKCPGCFKSLERQYHPTDRLNFDEIKYIMDFSKKRGAKAIVYAGLGEPMMDQDFWKALDYACKNKMWTELFTNGTFITKSNAGILYKKKANVIIKINTLDKGKQDAMAGGIEGAGEKIFRGLGYLLKAGFKVPRLAADSVIAKDNAEDLKDVLRFCRKNKITPYFESFITKTLRKEDQEGRTLSQEELDQLFLELQKIDREEFEMKTKLVKGMRVYAQDPCKKYWTMFSVRNNGDVALCVSDVEIIGNMREQSLEEILTPKNKKILERYKSGCNCSLTTSEEVEKNIN
jgi:MoaA/NifB/PqqE/SkfB family radical SAM enzyme